MKWGNLMFGLFTIVFTMTLAVKQVGAQVYTDLHDLNGTTDGSPCAFGLPGGLTEGRDGNLYGTLCTGGAHNVGTVFKITPTGSYRVLYDFDVTHGSNPVGNLALGADGNLYGVTENGGTESLGTLFAITPSGTLTVLHNFTEGSRVGFPTSPLIQGSDGNFYGIAVSLPFLNSNIVYNLTPSGEVNEVGGIPDLTFSVSSSPLTERPGFGFYGTTPAGGAFGDGTVFVTGTVPKLLYSFDQIHGLSPGAGGLVLGNDGNFYGTTALGGTNGSGVAFKITPGGSLLLLHNFFDGAGSEPIAGLVLASDRSFYGLTFYGGINNNGLAFRIPCFRCGPSYSVLFDFDGTHGGNPGATPTQHTNGKIYGIANTGGAHNSGVIYSLDFVGQFVSPCVKLVRPGVQVGQTMGVLGQGFTGTTSMTFGTLPASHFRVVSDKFLTAVVPSGTTGFDFLEVTTPTGTLTSNQKFIVQPVISSFIPTSGAVGTTVVIGGSGLTGVDSVTFGGHKASFVLNSDSELTATVPTSATTGKVRADTVAARGTSTTVFEVTK
jgi:uncharacterized repeat protein (TIGR03803 family)